MANTTQHCLSLDQNPSPLGRGDSRIALNRCPDIHQRRSIRWQGHDDSARAYVVSLCTQYGESLFGDSVVDEINLAAVRQIVVAEWLTTAAIHAAGEWDA